MKAILLYLLAAALEIGGCFAFWKWSRDGGNAAWLVPGLLALAGFAWVLSRVEVAFAGRAYAAYGGIYIASALVFLWVFEGQQPDVWDWSGAGLCVAGAMLIVLGPRG